MGTTRCTRTGSPCSGRTTGRGRMVTAGTTGTGRGDGCAAGGRWVGAPGGARDRGGTCRAGRTGAGLRGATG
jgi:hypothetical protein